MSELVSTTVKQTVPIDSLDGLGATEVIAVVLLPSRSWSPDSRYPGGRHNLVVAMFCQIVWDGHLQFNLRCQQNLRPPGRSLNYEPGSRCGPGGKQRRRLWRQRIRQHRLRRRAGGEPRTQYRSAQRPARLQHVALHPARARPNGTAAARRFSGPGIDNFDLALMKDLHFTESSLPFYCLTLSKRGSNPNA